MRFNLGNVLRSFRVWSAEEILQTADSLFVACRSGDLRGLVAEKAAALRKYDVVGMDRIVAICAWGRSGSVLLASYLDGHDDVIMLPEILSTHLNEFFDRYPAMPQREKLIAYPAYQQRFSPFFEGAFAIAPEQYYAAVQAITEVYGNSEPRFFESRRAFFLFVHIAYDLALGRRVTGPRPLIVYAQHHWDDTGARRLVEDFPQAKFIHTVRDPITLCDRLFESWMSDGERSALDAPQRESVKGPAPARPWWAPLFRMFAGLLPRQGFGVLTLVNRDQPHSGMESRTRAVRFEDLHRNTAETMRALAWWLGLEWQPVLTESTFNGSLYVVTRGGKAWSGRSQEQAERHSKNVSAKDRALLFALFYENFVAWDYPCPPVFGSWIVRSLVFFSLILIPMKMEFVAAKALFGGRFASRGENGRISRWTGGALRVLFCRMAVIGLLAPEFLRRCACRKTLIPFTRASGAPAQASAGASESAA